MKKTNIIIADSHKLIRESIGALLNCNENFKVLAELGRGEEVVAQFASLLPDVIIIDIKIDGLDCAQVIKSVLDISKGVKIICLSHYNDSNIAKEMFELGAMGFLSKNASSEHLRTAICEICSGRKYICDEIKADFLNHFLDGGKKERGHNSLTRREQDVIAFINKGLSSKEIASILSLSTKTVEVHRYNIFKKLNIKKATALVNYMKHKASA